MIQYLSIHLTSFTATFSCSGILNPTNISPNEPLPSLFSNLILNHVSVSEVDGMDVRVYDLPCLSGYQIRGLSQFGQILRRITSILNHHTIIIVVVLGSIDIIFRVIWYRVVWYIVIIVIGGIAAIVDRKGLVVCIVRIGRNQLVVCRRRRDGLSLLLLQLLLL